MTNNNEPIDHSRANSTACSSNARYCADEKAMRIFGAPRARIASLPFSKMIPTRSTNSFRWLCDAFSLV
jgi:hypothetical protein